MRPPFPKNRRSVHRAEAMERKNDNRETLSQASVMKMAVIVEATLTLVALIGAGISGRSLLSELALSITTLNTLKGLLLATALFAFNCLFLLQVLRQVLQRFSLLKQVYRFNRTYVVPLAEALNFRGAIIISLLAGFGEELFFRGLLQPLTGILISGAVFALLHFGTLLGRYPLVVVLYFTMSCIFGVVYDLTNSLWAVCIAHSVYDLIVLTYVRHNTAYFLRESN